MHDVEERQVAVINQSDLATEEFLADPRTRQLATELAGWVNNARGYGSNAASGSMFDRTIFVPTANPYEQMRSAKVAVEEDDVVAGAADITEAIAFKGGHRWEGATPEECDIFNQLGADLDLDAKIRQLWREDFTYSQAVVAKLWDWRDYTVRGTTAAGNKRKKRVHIWVPVRLILLNQMHCAPIGWGPLREDRIAWQGTDYEIGRQAIVSSGGAEDPLMTSFYTGLYKPTNQLELARLAQWGVQPNTLLEMRREWVFRHAPLRPDYEMFAPIAMRSLFADLDLKRQLMLADRAALVGAANYILLLRKGTDQKPALQEELGALQEHYRFLAKLPVIISDHRLQIDIIAPKQDFALQAEKYAVLDDRILNRMLRGFQPTGKVSAVADGSYYDVVAAGIESRRHMIKRTLEREVGRAVVAHPRNRGVFEAVPSLAFTPGGVKVGTNQAALAALLALRTQRELSRETILEVLGLDESVEFQRLQFEAAVYDETFKTHVPFDGAPAPTVPPPDGQGAPPDGQPVPPDGQPVPEPSAVSGRRGGRPPGGGSSPQSPAAVAKPKTSQGNPTTKGL